MTESPTPQNAWVPPDTRPTRLILLRHGVTPDTLAKRFAGRSDPELAAEGVAQAARAALRVQALGPIDAILSSPLRRAQQTAQAVSERLALTVELDPGFVETDFGEWDGFTFAEVEQRSPGKLLQWMNEPSSSPPGGESLEAVTSRVVHARDRLLSGRRGQRIVVVSHVTPIKLLVRLALDAPMAAVHRMFLEPASITVIDYYEDGPVTVRSLNDAAHLYSDDS